jgi:hypothetical protein
MKPRLAGGLVASAVAVAALAGCTSSGQPTHLPVTSNSLSTAASGRSPNSTASLTARRQCHVDDLRVTVPRRRVKYTMPGAEITIRFTNVGRQGCWLHGWPVFGVRRAVGGQVSLNIHDVAATGAWGPFKQRLVHLAPGRRAVALLLIATPLGQGTPPCGRSYTLQVRPPGADHAVAVHTGAGTVWPAVCSAHTAVAVSPVHPSDAH